MRAIINCIEVRFPSLQFRMKYPMDLVHDLFLELITTFDGSPGSLDGNKDRR